MASRSASLLALSHLMLSVGILQRPLLAVLLSLMLDLPFSIMTSRWPRRLAHRRCLWYMLPAASDTVSLLPGIWAQR